MIFIYAVLIGAGALPLLAFFIRRKRYRFILENGIPTVAKVIQVRTVHRKSGAHDQVGYQFLPTGANRYESGVYIFKIGRYKVGDTFPVRYIAESPQKHAIEGSSQTYEAVLLAILIALFLFVIFVCYQLNEMLSGKTIRFKIPE